jgi:hypothetical protein
VRNGGSGIYDAAIEEHPPARGLAAVVRHCSCQRTACEANRIEPR